MSSGAIFGLTLASQAWRLGSLYKIKTKQKLTAVMKPNPLQLQIVAKIKELEGKGKPIRLIILKPRQIGCTTFFGIRYLDRALFNRNQFAAIVAHQSEKADEIFCEIIKFAYDNLSEHLRFKAYNDSVRHLSWRPIGSQIKVTSDGHGITPNMLHLTEVARMKNAKEMISETLQGVPRFGEVVQESTAAGKGGYFYDCCQDAIENPDSYWNFIFLRWWHNPEYSLPATEGFKLTEYEAELIARYPGLTVGNLVFRREKIQELLSDKVDEETGLSGEMLFRQNYPMTPEEAFITNSLSIFNVEALEWMRNAAREPIDRKQCGHGWFTAYREQQDDKEYLISCDTSQGTAKDYSAAIVIERFTGAIVATLRGKYIQHDLAMYLAKLGHFYNDALIAVERNDGHVVLNELIRHIGYQNVYHNREYDDTGRHILKPGFHTNAKTRPMIIGELERSIGRREHLLPDKTLIEECLNFGYVNGRMEAVHGNDDMVMAYAIGNFLYRQPSVMLMPPGSIEKPRGL